MFYRPLMFINIDKVRKLLMINGRCYVWLDSTIGISSKVYRISYRSYNIIGVLMK